MNNDRFKQFEESLENWKLMEAAGVTDDPLFVDMWDWGNSPLANGKHAARFQGRLKNIVLPRALANQIAGVTSATVPQVDASKAVILGCEVGSHRPIALDVDVLNRHVLVIGSTGSGKTTLLGGILAQALRRRAITVAFQDHKGEGRRLLNIYRGENDCVVFRPDQEPWNMLEPVGQPEGYWWGWVNEFGRAFNLRPETWTELVGVLSRVQQGLKPGDPYPSLKDFERILLHLAEKEGRPKLQTAAHALASLNSLMGRTAQVRRAPAVEKRYRTVIYEHQGLPPRIHGFLSAVRLLRTQIGSLVEGVAVSELRHLCVSDEGTHEFGQELSQSFGSGYISPHKRAITQLRSAGTGILAGIQMVSGIDESLKSNIATVVCLRCPSPREAREAAQILGLSPENAPDIQNLPVGMGYVRSEGFSGPVKILVPHFQLGPYPSNQEVTARMAAEMTRLEAETVYSPAQPADARPLDYQEILDGKPPVEVSENPAPKDDVSGRFFDEHRSFLREIARNAQASVTEHYRNLGWSAGRGNRVKEQLVAMGLIISERRKTGNGRPREILSVTEEGRELLNEN